MTAEFDRLPPQPKGCFASLIDSFGNDEERRVSARCSHDDHGRFGWQALDSGNHNGAKRKAVLGAAGK
ncbi:hypothetical protein CGZ80_04830 [Rhodopirellula sp. MGV]|nr:hypothetical protein CGZ80_04830 [Rhodopirellula sp. MGV]PNY37859.1 hypothetical protein C2E31_04960 [Rhodopirellula baltica]